MRGDKNFLSQVSQWAQAMSPYPAMTRWKLLMTDESLAPAAAGGDHLLELLNTDHFSHSAFWKAMFVNIDIRGGRGGIKCHKMNSSTYIHEDTYYRDSLTSRRAMTNVSNLHRSPLDLSSRQKTILITIC